MDKHRMVLTTLLVLLSSLNATSSFSETPQFNKITGHWYSINPMAMSWSDAKESAESAGGYLSSIASGEENKWISDVFGIAYNNDYYWLGGNDIPTEGVWTWANGEPWGYTNWHSGEPNNVNGVEDALTWRHETNSNEDGYTWNDRNPSEARASLVEYNSSLIYNNETGHWYSINPISMPWNDAKEAAESAGGYLASITSGEENKWISDTFGITHNDDYYWFGGNDITIEGVWAWANGEPWGYTNWNSAEPNNSNGTEDALTWRHESNSNEDGYEWNDRDPSQLRTSLVEFDFDPSLPPYFQNITLSSGLEDAPAFRIAVADVNNDGYPDLLVHRRAEVDNIDDVIDKQFLYLNVPGDNPNDPHSRKFIDFTNESGIRANRRGTDEGRHSSLAAFADVDNDGDLDMFSGHHVHRIEHYNDTGDRNDLFLNDGTGRFSLAPDTIFHDAGILNTSSATFLDYNLDGNVDLFIGNWWDNWDASISHSDRLYLGNGDGSFKDVTAPTGLNFEQPTYAVSAADTDNDGYMDLFASNYCRSSSIHWQNNGDGTFSQIQQISDYGQFIGPGFGLLIPPRTCSWGSMPRDFDNDGDIDFFELMVHGAEAAEHSTVLINENNIFTWHFEMIARPDAPSPNDQRDHNGSWFDIDNDGLSDFVLSQAGHLDLFKQTGDHSFKIVNDQSGIEIVNTLNLPPHNATPFDFDLDGDEDLIIGFIDGDLGIQLWRNDVGNASNWITVSLLGAGRADYSNKSAIGARVEVTSGGKTYTREVYAGNGHFAPQKPMGLTFGLGAAEAVDNIKVSWPNSNHTVTVHTGLGINQFIRISEPPEIQGDLNYNGCVDGADLQIILGEFRNTAFYDPTLDLNGDGNVNIADVRYLVTLFTNPRGASCPLNIISNSNWRSSDTAHTGWETVNFDDSSWDSARAPYPSAISPDGLIPGTVAQHIWHDPLGTSDGKTGPNETFLRFTFYLANWSSGNAQIVVDDDYNLYVNGNLAYENHDQGGPDIVDEINIKPFLKSGKNVIAIHAVDGGWDSSRQRAWERVLVDAVIQ